MISCKDLISNVKSTDDRVDVKCLRKQRLIDRIFTGSTATLVAIIYINFGCVVQWAELRNLVRKPVGPAIGFLGQFIVMPVVSLDFYLSDWKILFPYTIYLQVTIQILYLIVEYRYEDGRFPGIHTLGLGCF